MTSTAAGPAPERRPTETRENQLSGPETLEILELLEGGGESTTLMATAEGSRAMTFSTRTNVLSVKLMVGNGVSELYLDD